MILMNNFTNDSRVYKEANTLGQEGHTVQILALHSKGLKDNENFKNFDVKRIVLNTREKLSNKNKYIQAIKYFEFFMKCLDYANEFFPDVVHCHDIYTVPIGFKIRKKTKSKLVYDSHELWSRVHNIENSPKIFKEITKYYEKKAVKSCDKVITVSNSISNYFLEHYELINKPLVIRNIPEKNLLSNNNDIFRKKFNILAEQKIILYQGAVQVGRGVDKIIELIPQIDDKIVLVVLGNGPLINKLKDLAITLNVDKRVFFHEAVNQEDLIYHTNSADVGIHLMENICLNHYYALPNKIFEYLQAGLPIICSEFPEMRKIVKEYDVGIVVNPEEHEKTADLINLFLLDEEQMNLAKENVIYASQVLCWENEEKKLIDTYNILKSY